MGSGLAGSEAAYFLAERGIQVILHEMRPKRMTEAHQTGKAAELVCSNSLKSKSITSAPGILKSEMTRIGSLILRAAGKASIPGGEALTVDRDVFSQAVTESLDKHPNIVRIESDEVVEPFSDGPTLFATGPLTSDGLSQWLAKATGTDDLYFYDAIAPIVETQSLDMDTIYLANRYDKGEEKAYLNCPFNKEQYENFVDALLGGERVPPKNFEKEIFFHACQPIEAIADKGRESLRFGPMRPVGLPNPHRNGEIPYAVVQLRAENRSQTAYNLVGFQTKLKYGAQKQIFKMIPGLENARFHRMGSIHRNTYVCGPRVLRPDLSLKGHPSVYLAGQITGVEGYLESSACGLLAGLFIAQRLKGQTHSAPPANTALGSLLRHIVASPEKNYQPANIHFGLFETDLFEGVSGKKREVAREMISKQSVDNLSAWLKESPFSDSFLFSSEPSSIMGSASENVL